MYIPITFLGAQNDCIECQFSSSLLPDGITWNKVNDEWVYLKIPVGKSLRFTTKNGVSSRAKMLLVGGGGYAQSYGTYATGGGGGGQVIFKDFGIQPDIEYFVSSSAVGGRSLSQTGGSSTFIQNYVPDPVNWTQDIAVGGDSNTTSTGGDSGNGFTGGTSNGKPAGGGGAGSTSNGFDATGPGNQGYGGNAGSGSIIPSPFNSVVGNIIAGGGPGDGTNSYGTYEPGGNPNAYGQGASGASGTGNGKDGVAFLFFPISGCETGSRENLDFKAEGGTTGTFFSGSVQYKYHAFTNEIEAIGGQETFNVTQGITKEAKTMVIGSGAGSSAYWLDEYIALDEPIVQWYQTGGGAGAGGVKISEDVTLWGNSNLITVHTGGEKFSNGDVAKINFFPTFADFDNAADGGGRGAYDSDGSYTPSTGNANGGGSGGGGYYFVDNTGAGATGEGLGSSGGDGKSDDIVFYRYGGGGGGGASSTGSDADRTNPSFPNNAFAKGGSGYDLRNTFWSFLTGSVFTNYHEVGQGGSGSAGHYATVPYQLGNPRPALTASGDSNTNDNDGSGASPNVNGGGNSGIVIITYPISGSITNS